VAVNRIPEDKLPKVVKEIVLKIHEAVSMLPTQCQACMNKAKIELAGALNEGATADDLYALVHNLVAEHVMTK
jgi:hypothetical protein